MNDFRDPELEHTLGRLSGAYPDVNTAYVAVTGRVRQAKRRRALVASTTACALLLGLGALAVRGGATGEELQPADHSSEVSMSASMSSVATSVEDDSTSSSEETTSSSIDTSASVDTSTESSTATSAANSTASSPGSSTSHGPSTSSGKAPVTTAADGQLSPTSAGGSITVAVVDGSLNLVGISPAAGFTADVKHQRADRVEVEFNGDGTTWRIRIDLKDGTPQVEVSSH